MGSDERDSASGVDRDRAGGRLPVAESEFLSLVESAVDCACFALDAEGVVREWSAGSRRLTGHAGSAAVGEHAGTVLVTADDGRDRGWIDRLLREAAASNRAETERRIVRADGSRFRARVVVSPLRDDGGNLLGYGAVVLELTAREGERERRRRLEAVIGAVDDALAGAESRAEFESTVVDRIAAAKPYPFAAVGEIDADAGAFDPRARSVAAAGAAPDRSTIGTLGARALETDAVQVRRGSGPAGTDRSLAVVPVAAGDRRFGVLAVATADPTAFADRERVALAAFGRLIGHALLSLSARRLLYADRAIELEFESTDPALLDVTLSRELGCRSTLAHVVPVTEDVYLYYVTLEGADPDAVREFAAAAPAVRTVRLVADRGGTSDWEFEVRESTITELLAEYGAKTRSAVVEDGRSRTVVEVAPETNVRELVEAVRAAFPETDLVSKREVERSIDSHGDFREQVAAALTDKQRRALEAAYYGGYFEWPRDKSASELAEEMGVSGATFHQHLRGAEREIFTDILEGLDAR